MTVDNLIFTFHIVCLFWLYLVQRRTDVDNGTTDKTFQSIDLYSRCSLRVAAACDVMWCDPPHHSHVDTGLPRSKDVLIRVLCPRVRPPLEPTQRRRHSQHNGVLTQVTDDEFYCLPTLKFVKCLCSGPECVVLVVAESQMFLFVSWQSQTRSIRVQMWYRRR